ncbi:hypothetical protein GQ53DRAFT_821119 [Thozetella sp. PMI_491]|nr:hypothetical protein GQ53DRAFT_821119 [Thozetella sp. PMI_491]
MEAGASAIAFIGFGLTSLKLFRQFFSNIRDGPERIRDLSTALDSLRSAIQHIAGAPDLADILTSTPSLVKLLTQFNEDSNRFERKLKKLNISEDERLHGVLWKKLKRGLGEDDIAYLLSTTTRCLNALTLELAIMQL